MHLGMMLSALHTLQLSSSIVVGRFDIFTAETIKPIALQPRKYSLRCTKFTDAIPVFG